MYHKNIIFFHKEFCKHLKKFLNPLTIGAQSHLYACVSEANLEIMQKHERQE
jgi:hypothetical protein